MRGRSIKKWILACICIGVLSLVQAGGLYAQENEIVEFEAASYNTNRRTVKVGWFRMDGMMQKNEYGKRSGYVYDYLQELSKYAGLDYEYVDGSWDECYQWLKEGKIDLMPLVDARKDREEEVAYSEIEMGVIQAVLLTLNENEEIQPGNYITYNGKKVAVVKGTNEEQLFLQLMKKKGFQTELVECTDYKQAIEKLNNHEVDMTVTDSLLNSAGDLKTLEHFSSNLTYLVAKKGDQDLLERVDYGLNCIHNYLPNLSKWLETKYDFGKKESELNLTKEEQEYLKEHPVLEFEAIRDNGYLSYKKDGEEKGFHYRMMKEIAEQLQVDFTYNEVANYSELSDKINAGDYMAAAGYFYDYSWAEEANVELTSPYINLQYYEITNKEQTIPDEKQCKIAAVRQLKIANDYVLEHYAQKQITWYDSQKECLDAVRDGEVDLTYCNNFIADYYLDQYDYRSLSKDIIGYADRICFAVPKDQPILATILSKAIAAVGKEKIQKLKSESCRYNAESTELWNWMNNNPKEFAMAVAMLVMGVSLLLLFIVLFAVTKNKNIKIEKAMRSARMDSLTKIYNRDSIESLIREYFEQVQGCGVVAFIMMDVDNFKEINDTCGHVMGDKVLMKLARILDEQFSDDGIVARMGGDEFAVFLPNAVSHKNIEDKITLLRSIIREQMKEEQSEFKEGEISCSIGVAMLYDGVGAFSQIYSKADQALYMAKRNGKNQYVIN